MSTTACLDDAGLGGRRPLLEDCLRASQGEGSIGKTRKTSTMYQKGRNGETGGMQRNPKKNDTEQPTARYIHWDEPDCLGASLSCWGKAMCRSFVWCTAADTEMATSVIGTHRHRKIHRAKEREHFGGVAATAQPAVRRQADGAIARGRPAPACVVV